MRVKPKKATRKSILHDYVRMCYEEFAIVLCREIAKKNPKAVGVVKIAMKKVIDEHFGKDPGGDAFLGCGP